MCCKIHFVLPIVLRRSKEGVKIDRQDVPYGRVWAVVGAEASGLCERQSPAVLGWSWRFRKETLFRRNFFGGNPFSEEKS